MKKLLLMLLLCPLAYRSLAQFSVSSIFVPKSFSTLHEPVIGYSGGAAVAYYIPLSSSDWASEVNANYAIIKAQYIDMNSVSVFSNRVFGASILLTAGPSIRLLRTESGMNLSFNPAVGLSYSTKTFYNTANINQVVGSHLNIVSEAELALNYKVLRTAVGISHQSNSNVSAPNSGVNRIVFSFGILTDVLDEPTGDHQVIHSNTNHLDIAITAGEAGTVRTGYYYMRGTNKGVYPDTAVQTKTAGLPKLSLSLHYTHQLTTVFGLRLGSDLIYNTKPLNWDHFFQTNQGDYTSYNRLNTGITAGLSVGFSKLVFSGDYGYLIYSRLLNSNKHAYTAFSAQYLFTDNFGLQAKSYTGNFGGLGILIRI